MSTYPTYIHGPGDTARTQTQLVARCQVCGVEWQVRSPNRDDARGCSFCDAPKEAITIISEHPAYRGQVVD